MTAIKTRESAGDESKVGSTQAKATMKAAVIRGFGDCDVLRYEEIETPKFAALQKGLTTATTFVCRLIESRRRD